MCVTSKITMVVAVALALNLASASSAQGLLQISKARVAAKLKNNPLAHKAATLGLAALLLMPVVPSEVLAKEVARSQVEINVQQAADRENQDISSVLNIMAGDKLEDVVAITSTTTSEVSGLEIPDRNKIFILASIFGNLDVIKSLVSTGLQYVDGFGIADALAKSAYYGHEDVFDYLLPLADDHKQANVRQEAQLSSQRAERADALIEDAIYTFYATDGSGDPLSVGHQAFRLALKFGDLPVIKLMFDQNDEGVRELYDTFYGVHSTMRWAARYGHLDIVKYAWEQGGGSAEDSYFRSNSMYAAALKGHLDIVKYLHSMGLSPFIGLEDAFDGGHLDTIKYLLDAAFREATDDSDYDYLQKIVYRALIAGGDRARGVKFQKIVYRTLIMAAYRGNLEVVKNLLPHADGKRLNNLNSAMQTATRGGHLDIVKYLLAEGADDIDRSLQEARQYIEYGLRRGEDVKNHQFVLHYLTAVKSRRLLKD